MRVYEQVKLEFHLWTGGPEPRWEVGLHRWSHQDQAWTTLHEWEGECPVLETALGEALTGWERYALDLMASRGIQLSLADW